MADAPEPYYSYRRYLRERHGKTVYRVAVDAGFTCPHRGPGLTGCAYCGADGARAPYQDAVKNLPDQIARALGFLKRRYGAEEFLLYFQAFSNTNAPVDRLREIYDAGLACADFRALIVSTRPDCLDADKADLLASYKTARRDVWVELGLQSLDDATLARVNRGHTAADFLAAFELCRARGLLICVHLIFGLPTHTPGRAEGRVEIERTMRALASLRPDGVKLHNLHVVENTPLAADWRAGKVRVPDAAEHLENVIAALEVLPPDTVIMRLVCDTPADRLLAPRDFPDKQGFLKALAVAMTRRGARQGARFPGRAPDGGEPGTLDGRGRMG